MLFYMTFALVAIMLTIWAILVKKRPKKGIWHIVLPLLALSILLIGWWLEFYHEGAKNIPFTIMMVVVAISQIRGWQKQKKDD